MQNCHRPFGSCRGPAVCAVVRSRLHGSICCYVGRQTSSLACRAAADEASAEKHYAVIGAGLAGLATAYYLQKLAPAGWTVHVDVYDAVGIGAGGSGAAAGLLHPFTPKGKLLWKAHEAMSAALELLKATEAATTDPSNPIQWHTGMIKPAVNTKQSQDFWKSHSNKQQRQQQQQGDDSALIFTPHQLLTASVVGSSTAQQLVPGLQIPMTTYDIADPGDAAAASPDIQQQQHVAPQRRRQQRQQHRKLECWDPEAAAALHIPGGITLHPQRYMHALWAAAGAAAADRADGSTVSLHRHQLTSLETLCQYASSDTRRRCSSNGFSSRRDGSAKRDYNAVIVAAGAAIGSLQEFNDQQLPLSLCQGYTLDMVPSQDTHLEPSNTHNMKLPQTTTTHTTDRILQTDIAVASPSGMPAAAAVYGANSPSILGSPYLASQGGRVLVVGATKSHGWTAQQAFEELGRKINPSLLHHTQQQQQQDMQQQAVDNAGLRPTGRLVLQQQQQQQHGDPEVAAVSAAAAELLAGAAAVWPAVLDWQIGGIRTGVRAIPPRTQQGSVPILGRWQLQPQLADASDLSRPPVWLCVGLGARGLVYHAWLAQLTAQAVLSNSEECIQTQAPELLAWRAAVSSGPAGAAAAIREAE